MENPKIVGCGDNLFPVDSCEDKRGLKEEAPLMNVHGR